MKVRKKPVEVQAVQLFHGTWDEVCAFVGPDAIKGGARELDGSYSWGVIVERKPIAAQIVTREGVMIADECDWIIRGVEGEHYPCKPRIFSQTYEIVDELSSPMVVRSTADFLDLMGVTRVRQVTGLSFHHVDGNGNPRVFVGMHRPPWPIPEKPFGICRCGATQVYPDRVRNCWESGHMDRPLYRTEGDDE